MSIHLPCSSYGHDREASHAREDALEPLFMSVAAMLEQGCHLHAHMHAQQLLQAFNDIQTFGSVMISALT